jgi:multiple sugar transport system substrate-binding protein
MTRRRGSRFARRDFLRYSAATGLAASAAGRLAAPALAAGGEVNFATWSAAVDLVQSHAHAFEQKTGIKVNYTNSPWAQYRETLITQFIGGAPIDTLWVSDSWLPEWADAGWLVPVDEFAELMKYNDDASAFCNESMMYDGRQYGLTYYTDFMGFMYDEAKLEEAGISSPPETWQEVVEQSLIIKEKGISEFPLMLALAQETWLIEFLSAMVFSHGGRFVADEGAAVMQDEKEGAVEALRWVVDAIHQHQIVSPGCVEVGELTGVKAFASGNHAFALEPKYRMRLMNDPEQSQIAGRAKQILMPAGPNGSHATVGWMRFYGMTPQAYDDPERAADTVQLIEWFGGKADGEYLFQKLLFMDIGAGFGVKPLFEDPEIRETYNAYNNVDIVEQQQELAQKKDVISAWFGEWMESNGALWQQAILQQKTPEEAMAESGEIWDDLREEMG